MRAHPISCLLLACLLAGARAAQYSEEFLTSYLAGEYEKRVSEECHKYNVLNFNHETDLLNVSIKEALDAQELRVSAFDKQQWAQYFRDADWPNFKNEFVKRQLKQLSILGVAALDDDDEKELMKQKDEMAVIYSTAKICPYTHQHCDLKKEGMALTPGIEDVFASSTDYYELLYTWKAWRDASGAKMRENFKKYVEISNLAARANHFADMGAMWRDDFETNDFVSEMMKLWRQVEPLYASLHTYVGRKLYTVYGDKIGTDGLIPAHLLGNMWAQSWVHLYDLVVPYPGESVTDVTAALKEQKYSVLRMFETADDFYTSLGLMKNDMSYDETRGAMITKPDNKEVVCHASAWDMCNRTDFRIKMCTQVNSEDLVTIHHEMGHIQYYQQYKDLPYTFRQSTNPGFTEAIGDVIALSVATPQHLHKIGLLDAVSDSPEASINALMKTALAKVAFLPFGLLVDTWRWDVFGGRVNESQWNAHWWRLRESLQKVKSSVTRSENDFDPGAKYHVANDSKYISYFVSYILQFQLHKALCIKAGRYNPKDPKSSPLHNCDIFKSREAGSLLAKGLSLGSSKHWRDVLYVLTGERDLDGSALLEYFAPLQHFLNERIAH